MSLYQRLHGSKPVNQPRPEWLKRLEAKDYTGQVLSPKKGGAA
jgi:hypothetical protein